MKYNLGLVKEFLELSRDNIIKPERWCQKNYALSRKGNPVIETGKSACQWCSAGSVRKIEKIYFSKWACKFTSSYTPRAYLDNAAAELGYHNYVGLNDNTDHDTVIKMFNLAIEMVEEDMKDAS